MRGDARTDNSDGGSNEDHASGVIGGTVARSTDTEYNSQLRCETKLTRVRLYPACPQARTNEKFPARSFSFQACLGGRVTGLRAPVCS